MASKNRVDFVLFAAQAPQKGQSQAQRILSKPGNMTMLLGNAKLRAEVERSKVTILAQPLLFQ
jgi:hypothetical protein